MKNHLLIIAYFFLSLTANAQGDNLFDDQFLHEIRFTAVDSSIFINSKDYQQVHIEIDDVFIDSIGFKKKGNISATHENNKFPFKIKTNKYVRGKKYDDIKEFTLHNNYQDPSMMREKMTYDLMRDMGLHGLRAAFAKVYINDRYWGLYTLLEAKDELYKRKFDNNDGAVMESLDFGTMCYLGPNQSDYDSGLPTYQIDNGDEMVAWDNFIPMLDKANNTAASEYMTVVPKSLNLDHFFRYQAANVYLLNFDSYIGFKGNQLYYFDEATTIWEVIPWDFNASFGLWNSNNHRPFDYPVLPPDINNGCIASNINEVSELETVYFDAMCELATNLADTSRLINLIDQWRAQIESAVYEDTRKEFDNARFDQGTEYGYFNHAGEEFVPGMKTFVVDRWKFVQQQLAMLGKTCESTATQEIKDFAGIKIFPNPAQGFLTIEWLDEAADRSIKIMDANGRLVMDIETWSPTIDIRALPEGLYFLNLISAEQQFTYKFLHFK